MDGLPLAIVQAGAYIEETGRGLEDYLRLYKTHRKDVLARRSNLLLDYPETVATTWLLSFHQVEQQSPAAADVLRLCAFLAPDAIPEELLSRGAAELGAALSAEASDPFKLDEAMEVLRKYSLVQRNRSTRTLGIHRLVQIVLKDGMDQRTRRTWAERVVRATDAASPKDKYTVSANHQSYLPRPGVRHTQYTVPTLLPRGSAAALSGRRFSVFPRLLPAVTITSPASPSDP